MGDTVEIYLQHPGPGQQLAHRVAETLDLIRYLPMAYGDYLWIFADFRPGQGVREFPVRTSADAAGRDAWAQPSRVGVQLPPAGSTPARLEPTGGSGGR